MFLQCLHSCTFSWKSEQEILKNKVWSALMLGKKNLETVNQKKYRLLATV